MDFQYKVTVIVPVYNVEQYLRECLDSLVAQTIDHSQMEVLLINDGSTDNSLDICYEYAQSYFMFKVFSKENEGVSQTRNFGIRNAKGKYIMYLDGDDSLSKDTIKAVIDFFDKYYEQVDLVTYQERMYDDNGQPKPLHFRYKYLTKTGIYNLEKSYFCCQVRLNIAVKNNCNNNIIFDEKIGYHEDQMYCTEVVKNKMNIGYVNGPEYRYRKHIGSITSENMNPIYLFEKTTGYWENIFNSYTSVPKYIQALFFHDVCWKFSAHVLWPYHYSSENFAIAQNRIISMLNKVDNSVIMSYPNADNYQKLYWIRKKTLDDTCPIISKDGMKLYSGGKLLYYRKDVEVILRRIVVNNNKVKFVGFFKSPFFSYIKDVKLLVYKNDEIYELEKIEAMSEYYKAKEKTDIFWTLLHEIDITEDTELKFKVSMDGILFDTVFYNCNTVPFFNKFTNKFSIESLSIEQTRNSFIINPINKTEVFNSIKKNTEKCTGEIKSVREAFCCLVQERVWLYYDNNTVEKDNGFYQFIHDIKKDDGIKRYYILSRSVVDIDTSFSKDLLPSLVQYGSQKHKLLFLQCEKILTSYIEFENISPFLPDEFYQLADIFKAEIIYLQHGVLHAHLPWYYSPVVKNIDKVVISSNFELENLVNNYGFYKNDLIPTGMARYDYMNKNKNANDNRILFAPSWRGYFASKLNTLNGNRDIYITRILSSNYYINIMKFINNPDFIELLENSNTTMDIKLHPILMGCTDLFFVNSENVKIVSDNVNIEDYKLFITDFSSFVYDYAYLSRCILYFVPDMEEFRAGLNHYKELDLPFEKAFGKLTVTPESAIREIENIINTNFLVESKYKERMDNFFLPLGSCAENLYQHLININGGNSK